MSDSSALIEQAVARLRRGELVVVPTETVYGLAADARNPEAVRRIFALKRRPASRPLIVHIASAEKLPDWACTIPDYAWRLAERFWPGPLTLVLPRASGVPDAVTAGQDTVALRVPRHPLTLELLHAFGGGIAAPSANRYGQISPTTPAHVRAQFGEQTPLLLDGGPCQVGIESTIVACLEDQARVLRPGSIDAEALGRVLGTPVAHGGADPQLRVPGQTESHYAPKTTTFLLPRAELGAWAARHGGRRGFLGFAPPPFQAARETRLSSEPGAAAQQLYAALHELDAAELDWIVVEEPPSSEAWRAVHDRLTRAAAPK
jgi:L-threonylcarbamoyladenylate synthase